MKILVAYYSRTGTTEKIGIEIANKLHADVEVLKDKKLRTGWFGYIFAGRDGMSKSKTTLVSPVYDPLVYDVVIIGTPIWVNMTPAIRTYLSIYGSRIKNCAFFCTMGGSGGKIAMKEMGELCGKQPIAELELTDEEIHGLAYAKKISDFINLLNKESK